MQNDNQHLDFLISQHVDGCLDAVGKKSVEQRLLMDPEARELYQEHREVQDVLDDWGSRIPMINWDEFDKKLATRLERETVGGERRRTWTWWKPMAAAAALFVAAWVGYGWHAVSGGTHVAAAGGNGAPAVAQMPSSKVQIDDGHGGAIASASVFRVDDSPVGLTSGGGEVAAGNVRVTAPGDVAAAESLRDAIMSGLSNLGNVSNVAGIDSRPGSASAMNGFESKAGRSEQGAADRDGMPPLP